MAEITNVSGNYSLDFLMIPSEHIAEFNNFMSQYGNLDDYDLYRQILNTKSKLSPNLINQHIRNLDALAQMEGLVNPSAKRKIPLVKELLNADIDSIGESNVETQFWGGSSLLLWFLLLAAIWRRPFYGGFGGGFF
ncbi:hypothetical protein [Alkaliphilus transvaalensis]|uniref:hypothetical protein n=1 Tax=Alkaliphilus transvaalensis TaxID=114628 RepID=UPI00047D5225|nr:hypothetical protein [Alkaliphilus transvaalensis]